MSELAAPIPIVPAPISMTMLSVGILPSLECLAAICKYLSNAQSVRGLHHGPCSVGSFSNKLSGLMVAQCFTTGCVNH